MGILLKQKTRKKEKCALSDGFHHQCFIILLSCHWICLVFDQRILLGEDIWFQIGKQEVRMIWNVCGIHWSIIKRHWEMQAGQELEHLIVADQWCWLMLLEAGGINWLQWRELLIPADLSFRTLCVGVRRAPLGLRVRRWTGFVLLVKTCVFLRKRRWVLQIQKYIVLIAVVGLFSFTIRLPSRQLGDGGFTGATVRASVLLLFHVCLAIIPNSFGNDFHNRRERLIINRFVKGGLRRLGTLQDCNFSLLWFPCRFSTQWINWTC